MAESVTPEYLFKGAVYALEQCGVLLRDAALLYRNEAYASAAVLAAFAFEPLGQWKILLQLRKEMISGKRFTRDQIKKRFDDHEKKQQAGVLGGVVMRADRDTGLGRLITSRITAQPGTEESKQTEAALAQITRRKKKVLPTERHKQRLSALYVDPIALDQWNRPSTAITINAAYALLEDANNGYAGQLFGYNNLDGLKGTDPELAQALEQWSDRPTLLDPSWPELPGLVEARKIEAAKPEPL